MNTYSSVWQWLESAMKKYIFLDSHFIYTDGKLSVSHFSENQLMQLTSKFAIYYKSNLNGTKQ